MTNYRKTLDCPTHQPVRWMLPGLLSASYAIAFLDRALMAAAGTPIKHDLGLSDTQFGLLNGTAFAVLYCLCGLPLGWLADRADRRVMIAAGLLFWSVMTALCGLADSFAAFLLARIGLGLGEACLLPAGMSLLGNSMPKAAIGRATAIFLAGASIGHAGAHLAGGYLLIRLSGNDAVSLPILGAIPPWRMLFLLACVPGLVMAIVILATREPLRHNPPAAPLAQCRGAISHLWKLRAAYGFLTGGVACSITLTQAQAAWLPLYYNRIFGLSSGESAMSVGLMFILSAPAGQWAGGYLADRLRARGEMAAQNTVLALCAAGSIAPAVVFCTTHTLWLSLAAYLVFNFIVSASTPSGLAGWLLLTPGRYQALTTAILVSIVTLIGVGFGPPAVGLLTDNLFQDERALGLSMLAVIVTAGALGCALAAIGRPLFRAGLAQTP